jgi:hypothetical protein
MCENKCINESDIMIEFGRSQSKAFVCSSITLIMPSSWSTEALDINPYKNPKPQ